MKYYIALLILLFIASCQKSEMTDEDPLYSSDNQADTTKVDKILPSKTYERGGNIYLAYTDGKEKKLTFTGQDSSPFILEYENSILFIRTFKSANHSYKHIMSVNIDDLSEQIIIDKRPYRVRKGSMNTYLILSMDQLMISTHQTYLYFITEKYQTENVLVRLNLKTKKWVDVCAAEVYSIVKQGVMKDNFAIGVTENRGAGKQMYWFITDRKGQKLKDFGNSKAEMEHFLGTGNQILQEANVERAIVQKVILHSFPARKPSGKNWDNMTGGFSPDIYMELFDTRQQRIKGNKNNRIENVTKGDLPLPFLVNHHLKNTKEIITFQFRDFDSISEDDYLGTVSFDLTGYTKNQKSDRFEKDGFDLEIIWEWY